MNKNRVITYGDRVFARVIKNGKTIVDFVTENVSNLAELMDQLRILIRGDKSNDRTNGNLFQSSRGMVTIQIRNYHQGWGTERLMII